MTIFEEIKELVSVPTAAGHYGLEIRRGSMCLCPFHKERTPSMKLYGRNYHCFGCGAHGDVISLVQKLFGLSPIEAVRQINSDFSLGLNTDKPPERADIDRIRRMKAERDAYEKWENHAFRVLFDYQRVLQEYQSRYAPDAPDAPQDERFLYALRNAGYADYLSDEFMQAGKEHRLELKGEVERIEQELRKLTAG